MAYGCVCWLICFSNYRLGYMTEKKEESSYCAKIERPLRYDHVEKDVINLLLSDNLPHARCQMIYPFKLCTPTSGTTSCGARVACFINWRTAGPDFPFYGVPTGPTQWSASRGLSRPSGARGVPTRARTREKQASSPHHY